MESASIKEWKKKLNWDTVPNFGPCHEQDKEKFEKEYFLNDELSRLIENISELLSGDNTVNCKLQGRMGSGKTTFLYFLKKAISNSSFKDKYYFHIIRASKLDVYDEYEELLRELVVDEVFLKFFEENNQLQAYKRITEPKHQSKQSKLNKLKDYYKEFREQFPKKLIVVLDDYDTISDEEMAKNIAKSFKRILGSGSISKWISIRDETFDNYCPETQKSLSFFAHPFILPSVSMYDIIERRIKQTNGEKSKNPYSNNICQKVLDVENGSLRDALPVLYKILEFNTPPKSDQSEEFIQNWLEKATLKALLKSEKIINLHTEKFITLFNAPVAYDMLHTIKYSFDKNDIFSIVDEVIKKYRNVHDDVTFQAREKQLIPVFDLLLEYGLIKNNGGLIKLTEKGKAILAFDPHTYHSECQILSFEKREDIDLEYWKSLKRSVDYRQLTLDRNIWKEKGY